MQADDAERDGHEDAEAAGEAVEAVDQVDDIWHGDEPEDRDGERPRAEIDRPAAAGVGHFVNREAHRIDEHGGGDLPGELPFRAERLQVVPEAEAIHEQAAEEHGKPLLRLAGFQGEDDHQAERDRQHDGRAAEPGRRGGVGFAVLVGVVEADPGFRQPDDPRRGEQGDQKAEAEEKQSVNHGRAVLLL